MCYRHIGTYKIKCMQFMKRKINKNKSTEKLYLKKNIPVSCIGCLIYAFKSNNEVYYNSGIRIYN